MPQDRDSATATTLSHRLSSQPLATPTAATMSPNSLKLVRFNDANSDVRARSLNPASRPRKRADLKNTNGVTAAPMTATSVVSGTGHSDGDEEAEQEQVLEAEHGPCKLVGLVVAGDEHAEDEGAQVALQARQLECFRSTQGEQKAVEDQKVRHGRRAAGPGSAAAAAESGSATAAPEP